MNKSYQPTTQVETDKRLSLGKVMMMIEAQLKLQQHNDKQLWLRFLNDRLQRHSKLRIVNSEW